MSPVFATTLGPSAYWYLARGTGAVALVLLTASVVIGILGSVRFSAERWPRFAIDSVHRDVSLLVLVVLAVHIVTSVLDGFAPITLLDGVIPFVSGYRPLWMGLGTLAFDLLLAIAITSILRRRLGYRTWRAVHWLAYASWPVAVLHGLGTGSDVKQWWMLGLTVVCVVAVLAAVWTRIASASDHAGFRAPATALAVITPIGLLIFTVAGPLQTGWAKKAGTPSSLLAKPGGQVPVAGSARSATAGRGGSPTGRGGTTTGRGGATAGGGGSGGSHSAPVRIKGPFTSNLNGNVQETPTSGGAIVNISMQVTGHVHGVLRVRIGGVPIDGGGGLSMTGSQVDLAVAGEPSVFAGSIGFLQGTELRARVTNAQGSVLELHAVLQIDQQNSTATGTLAGTPA